MKGKNEPGPTPADFKDGLWVGDWQVDASSHRISRGQDTLRLEPRTMATLLCLARKPGQVVTRDEIEAEVWPRMVIGYDALNNTVAKLRRALGDDPRQPVFIETIPKVGYRLIADVTPPGRRSGAEDPPTSNAPSGGTDAASTPLDPAGREPESHQSLLRLVNRRGAAMLAGLAIVAAGLIAWSQPWVSDDETDMAGHKALPPPSKPSIVVLPFTNPSGEPEQDYFSSGLTDDLITNLSRIEGLFVVSRHSSFAYRDRSATPQRIASELGVRYVLEGSVRRSGDQVRINAQLTDATTGGYLWAQVYDDKLDSIFALQDRLTEKIIGALSVTLTPGEKSLLSERQTTSTGAYEAFLRGWEHFNRHTPSDFTAARRHLEEAITIDPDYGRAYAALAAVYWEAKQRGWYPAVRADYIKIRERALGYLEKAQQNPTEISYSVTAKIRMAHGDFPAAIAAAEKAVQLAPSDAGAHLTLAETLIYAGQPERALTHITRAMRLDPLHESYPLYLRGLAAFGLERFDVAIDFLARALEANPAYARPAAVLAAAYAHLGRDRDAWDALQRYDSEHESFGVASTVLAFPYRHEADRRRLAEGLRRAGMPEIGFKQLPEQQPQ